MRASLSILTAIVGLGLFLLGLSQRWFVLPSGFESNNTLILHDAPATFWWKCGCLLALAGIAVWLVFRRKSTNIRSCLATFFAVLLPFLLWYPQAVIVQDDATSGDAAWLQQQFDNLTWLGGDVPRAHSERPVPDGLGLWAQEPPHRLAAFRPPLFGPFSLGVAEMPDLVWWFGYNPAFSQFVGCGWILSVLGTLLLLAGIFGSGKRTDETGQRRSLLRITGVALLSSSAVVLLLALWPLLLGSRSLLEAREHTLSWQPQAALDSLETAENHLPALRFDTGVILQRGSLLRQLGQADTPPAKLHEAWLLFDQGYAQRSAAIIEDLVSRSDSLAPAERREALRGLLRSAVDDLNSNRLTEAKRRFAILLDKNPACIQGWFHYQLAALQSGDLESNRLAAARVEALSKIYLRKESRGIRAASQGMLAQGEAGAGNTAAAVTARKHAQGR